MRIAGGTAKRITKRIINFILVIWGVVTLSFCLQVFTGTDPAEMIVRKVNVFATEEQIQAVREELGLDAPFLERYTDYIKGVLTGDLGTAITNRQPVIENIKDALPVTCMLVVMAMAWVIIFTVLIAAISVIRKGGIFDNVMRIICIIGICVPSFWLALILLLMQRKRVLLLDEPFCGLDAESVFVVQQLILQLGCEGRTLLIAADSLALLDGICDDLYVLGGGQVQGRYEHYEFQRAIREAGSAAGFPKK